MLHLIAILLAAAPGYASPADKAVSPPAVGAAVAEFRLNDIHRRPRSFGGFKDKKAFVVAFVDTERPVSNLYVPSLIVLHSKYADKGVQFLAINSSSQDSFITVSAHAQDRNIPFPVLKDFDQDVADAFGATRTPEVFLLDADRIIRYHGRIDDQYGVGVRRDGPIRRDLADAVDDLLAGRSVARADTEVSGCPLERRRNSRESVELTYARHVAPHRAKTLSGMPSARRDRSVLITVI